MENILYLDEFINFYNKKINKLISIKPYKKTLNYGKIKDKNKFIKSFNNIKEKYKINNNIFNEKVYIIINKTYTIQDKLLIKEIMEELNYKNITFINELELIKIDSRSIFINYNQNYLYLYYINELGDTLIKIYENDFITKKLLIDIINLINKEKIIVTGKNYKELINLLDRYDKNYYYYEDNNNLFITLLKINNV